LEIPNENVVKKIPARNRNSSKNDIRGMIKDLFSNDFLDEECKESNNFSKTKYDKGSKIK
jgi:hypothetical protein